VGAWHIYNTPGGVNVRSCPSSACARVGGLTNGAVVDIICQMHGEWVSDGTYWSDIWDLINDGDGWVSDLYVNTPVIGQFTPGIGECDHDSL